MIVCLVDARCRTNHQSDPDEPRGSERTAPEGLLEFTGEGGVRVASKIISIVLLATGVWIAAVWLAGLVYVLVSYASAASHMPRRSATRTIRAMLREMWLVMWTQPLIPVFQVLVGSRLGTGGGDAPVVLVHGYFQNRVDFLHVARELRARGAGPLFAVNFFWPQSLERSSAEVERFVDRVRASTGAEKIDVLTHSSGGLLVLDMIARRPRVVRRAVMIALPGRGVPWRGPLIGRSGTQLRAASFYRADCAVLTAAVPTLSIFSAHDNVVHPTSTSELCGPQAVNVEVEEPGHLSVLFDGEVVARACRFLTAKDPLKGER